MSVEREARLILRLVDKVSVPAKVMVGALNGVRQATGALNKAAMAAPRAIGRMGRHARRASYDTALLSAPIIAGASAAARSVYEYKKMGNAMEAVGRLTESQRGILERYGKTLNEDFPFLNKDILGAAFELGRAGQSFTQIMGSLRSTLNVALAGDMPLKETADIMTNIAQAMRLPMETADQTKETMKRIGDALAYAATRSNTDIHEMGVMFRYVAPLAAATGMSLEEASVAAMNLANNGIKASNAGTGLRFALARLLNPSKAALSALNRLDINLGDYIKGARAITGAGVVGQLALDGIDAKGLESKIDKVLNDPAIKRAPAKLVAALTEMISNQLGDEGIIDRKVLSDSLAETLTVLGTDIDFRGLLRTLRDNPDAEALIPTIFGARHGPKIMALLAGDFDGTLKRMVEEYSGAANKMAKVRTKGIVGVWLRLQAVIDNLIQTLSDTGVLGKASNAITAATDGIRKLGEVNPMLLEFGTYALLGLASLAPLGFAIAGVAAALGVLLNPLVLVGGAVAYLAASFAYRNWEKITSAVSGFANGFRNSIGPRTQKLIDSAADKLNSFWSAITGATMNGKPIDWRKWGGGFGRGLALSIEGILRKFDQAKASLSKKWADIKRAFSNWDGILPRPDEFIKWLGGLNWSTYIPDVVWSDFIPQVKWGDYIATINWKGMLPELNWRNAITALEWASLIPLLRWARRVPKLSWGLFVKSLKWFSFAKVLRWSTLLHVLRWAKFIPYIGWAALAGELLWNLIIKPLNWDKYLNIESGKQILRDFADWVSNLFYNFGGETGLDLGEALDAARNVADLKRQANDKKALPLQRKVAQEALKDAEQLLSLATKDWPAEAKKALNDYVNALAAGGADAEAEAARLAERIKELLSVKAKPEIDTGSIDDAIGKAQKLRTLLNAANGINMPAKKPPAVEGARARGGPVRKGKTYLTGENGPELFTPNANGYVHSNSATGNLARGGDTFHFEFHVTTGDPEAFAMKVEEILRTRLSRSRQTSMTGRSVF